MDRALSKRAQDASFFVEFSDLTLCDEIGGGASSIVYRGYWLKCPVAVKKWFDPTGDPETLREFNGELLTLRSLRHPNVVPCFAACGVAPNLCFVMEYLPTSLFDLLHNSATPLEDRRILAMALDMVRALIYLHAQTPPVIHRDIKPANFLLDRAWRVKLCDFGLAANAETQRRAGTVAYMAPELFDADASYDASVDVFAFGVVLNEMLNRRLPYDGASDSEIRRSVLSGDRPEIPLSCHPALSRVIQRCWSQDATQRPTPNALYALLTAIEQN